MQNPLGACGTGWMLGAFAVAMLAPTNPAETTNSAASAILLSMGSPCGFVFAIRKPTRRIGARTADHAGATRAPWGKDLISTA